MKKYIAAIMMAVMAFSATAVAAPITANTGVAEYGSITFAELVRAVVVAHRGELPQIADAHYALPYVLEAEKLGILAVTEGGHNTKVWCDNASRETINSVLDATKKVPSVDMEKVVAAVNALLVKSVTVEGSEMTAPVTQRNGSIMLPLRAVSEALGYKVEWNQLAYSATINNDKIKSTVEIGYNAYYYTSVHAVGMTQPKPMASAPLLIDGVTYVPLAYFGMMEDFSQADGVITIVKQ